VTAIRIAPVWVFLDGGRFAAKGGDNAYWILLDFLGFSHPNRDFSMGYYGLARTVFCGRFSPPGRRNRHDDRARICVSGEQAIHEASLALFPIFCNRSSALMAIVVGSSFEALNASSVMAGLVPAIHARRLHGESDVFSSGRKTCKNNALCA
jgi:hypothetical protein